MILLAAAAAHAQSLEPGEVVGPVELTRLDGSKLVMSNYVERPATAVLFLSARCEVTEEAIAAINELYRKYRQRTRASRALASGTWCLQIAVGARFES